MIRLVSLLRIPVLAAVLTLGAFAVHPGVSMASTTVAWGPVSIPANTPTTSPAVTIPAADTSLQVTADFSALPAGVHRVLLAQYRASSASPWIDYGSATGDTVGGPDLGRQGTVIEWGIIVSPLPNPGTTGRQVRVTLTLSQAATLSGHVITATG